MAFTAATIQLFQDQTPADGEFGRWETLVLTANCTFDQQRPTARFRHQASPARRPDTAQTLDGPPGVHLPAGRRLGGLPTRGARSGRQRKGRRQNGPRRAQATGDRKRRNRRCACSICKARALCVPDQSGINGRPTPGSAVAHGESEDHHSRGDDCDRDPVDTKNSLHDGHPCLESGRSRRITVHPSLRALSEIGSHSAYRCARVAADRRSRCPRPDLPARRSFCPAKTHRSARRGSPTAGWAPDVPYDDLCTTRAASRR